MLFQLKSEYAPTGDQPQAIEKLVASIRAGNRHQTLLGVTGSGKTFTMANVIAATERPTLVLSHNKTLAAQLYSEFKAFFPENAVEYFVSYYDYYQPEAYVPSTDTYIEKDSSINDEIERLRISASSALISRRDVIVVASVSCIYGLGDPDDFKELRVPLRVGERLGRQVLLVRLVEILYERNDVNLTRGCFRVRGDVVDIHPAYAEAPIRVEFFGDEVESIAELDAVTGRTGRRMESFDLYPANQYVTTGVKRESAIASIRAELTERVAEFETKGRLLEAQRISMRTNYDLEMLQEIGFCNGIENYSRHMSGRPPGSRPFCLLDFFPRDFLTIIDESHATVPQVGAMYEGDRSRKSVLVDHGFRLPSALDNRPLNFGEFEKLVAQVMYVSATPAAWELQRSAVVAEQVIRPTGLLDPEIRIKPTQGQVEDLQGEISGAVEAGERVLVTTLTKRLAEDITAHLRARKVKVEYLHSDIDAIERVEILRRLRRGYFDVLVGINLLREGLDLPEVALVAVLDADKEGFLRSETSLIQTAGRAARHERGRVVFYADVITESIRRTLEVTAARRERQLAYNQEHGITPRSVRRGEQTKLGDVEAAAEEEAKKAGEALGGEDVAVVIAELEEEMAEAAQKLEFERAAVIRDQIALLRSGDFRKPAGGSAASGGGERGAGRRKAGKPAWMRRR